MSRNILPPLATTLLLFTFSNCIKCHMQTMCIVLVQIDVIIITLHQSTNYDYKYCT